MDLTPHSPPPIHAVCERAAPEQAVYEVAAAKNMPDTLETLASRGYFVASVEHTGDDDAFYQAYFLETYVGLSLGPDPRIASPSVIFQRSKGGCRPSGRCGSQGRHRVLEPSRSVRSSSMKTVLSPPEPRRTTLASTTTARPVHERSVVAEQ